MSIEFTHAPWMHHNAADRKSQLRRICLHRETSCRRSFRPVEAQSSCILWRISWLVFLCGRNLLLRTEWCHLRTGCQLWCPQRTLSVRRPPASLVLGGRQRFPIIYLFMYFILFTFFKGCMFLSWNLRTLYVATFLLGQAWHRLTKNWCTRGKNREPKTIQITLKYLPNSEY